MNKKLMVLFVVLLGVLSISSVSANDSGSFNDLDTLIENNGDTVELTKNYTRTDTDDVINVTKSITINGNNMVLDGNNKGQIMHINSNLVVTINDVIFIRGNSQSGGALFIGGGTVILNNCKFLNNTASERGGAILNQGNLTIDNCVFDNNNITTRDSNSNYGGAAIAHMSTINILTVKNTNVTNNLPGYTPRNGNVGDLNTGAVMVYGVSNFINCNFLKNNGCYGGAITATGNKGAYVTIDNCNFEGNIAFNGGAISNVGSTVIVKNTKFINNKAIGSGSGGNPSVGGAIVSLASADNRPAHSTITNSIFKNNHADSQGGAISGESGNHIIRGCRFEGNDAGKTNGGAIELTLVNSFSAKIENCNFTDNKASAYGGAIYTTTKNSGTAIGTGNEKLIINNSIFAGNTAKTSGGAVYIGNKGDANITNSVFTNNKADNGRASNTATGGAISTSSTTLNLGIKKSNFTNNVAGFYGGALYAPNNGNLYIDQSLFTGNRIVTRYGGAVYIGNKGNATVTNSEFTNNSAKSYGGALYIPATAATLDGATVNIENGTFLDNAGGKGNAIYIIKNSTILTNIISNGDIVAKDNSIVINATDVKYITSTNVANVTANSSEEVVVVGTVSPNAQGNVKVTIGTKTETATVTNGAFSVNMGYFAAGSYDIIVKFIANNSYLASEGRSTLKVKSDITLDADDVVKYFKNGTQYTVKVTDIDGNPVVGKKVLVTLNSPNWSKNAIYNITTDSNGVATLIINLAPGVYSITAKLGGESITNSITVLALTYNLDANDIFMEFKDGTKYTVTLTDKDDNPLNNQKIVVILNSAKWKKPASYTLITNASGVASLAINLSPGQYTATAKYDKEAITTKINVLKTQYRIEGMDVIKYFKNGTQYSVKVTDINNNPVVGKTLVITLNSPNWSKNAVYNIITDSNGVATLAINLAPGVYSITANLDGESVKNTLTIIPTLTTENLIKPVNQPGALLANLVDGQGNPLAGKNIAFTVKTKNYTKITDHDGNAMLPINLGVGIWTINISDSETGAKTTAKVIITK